MRFLNFCQQSISNSLILAGVLILLIGVASFLVQLYKTWILRERFAWRTVALPKRVQRIIAVLNLKNRVDVIADANLFSFCVGLFSPRVMISTGLVGSLSDKELEAVFLHEQAHIQNFDPLKMIFGQTIASMFFFLPIFHELNKNMITINELMADNWAVKKQQIATFIKRAMKKILVSPQVAIVAVPAVSHPDSLEIRIYRLVNPGIKHNFYLSRASIIITILFLGLGLFVWQTPVKAQREQCHLTSEFRIYYNK